jgi:hypothetical protein
VGETDYQFNFDVFRLIIHILTANLGCYAQEPWKAKETSYSWNLEILQETEGKGTRKAS